MKNIRKNIFGYVAITLTLALVVVSSVALMQMNATAGAEAVTVAENATVVTSPFTDAVRKVRNSVVGVNNYARYNMNNYYYGFGYGFGFGYGDGRGNGNGSGSDEDNTREVLQGGGSGVVVANGYVLTNYHVVKGASTLEITSGENTYPAELAGSDENRDIAVLKVKGMEIAPVTLGDSDLLNVGDWAICIGNPLSFTGTTTVGVISALNREVSSSSTDAYGMRTTNTMIQTDAAINSGNSGGGMFNVAGELVGIPSMKYSGTAYSAASVEGIGMAIPINEAKTLINDVLSGSANVDNDSSDNSASSAETAKNDLQNKPRLGVTVTNITNTEFYNAVANGMLPTGAYVSKVDENSPAHKAGIQTGDIIVEIDGNVITTTTQMIELLRGKNEGDQVAVKLYRVEGGLDKVQGSTLPKGEYISMTVALALIDAIAQ